MKVRFCAAGRSGRLESWRSRSFADFGRPSRSPRPPIRPRYLPVIGERRSMLTGALHRLSADRVHAHTTRSKISAVLTLFRQVEDANQVVGSPSAWGDALPYPDCAGPDELLRVVFAASHPIAVVTRSRGKATRFRVKQAPAARLKTHVLR